VVAVTKTATSCGETGDSTLRANPAEVCGDYHPADFLGGTRITGTHLLLALTLEHFVFPKWSSLSSSGATRIRSSTSTIVYQTGKGLINAVTGQVGPDTQVSGNPTYQDLAASCEHNFRLADQPAVTAQTCT
jgi:hypothetical protein